MVMERTEDITVQQIGNIVDDTNRRFKNPQTGRVYSVEGLAPCLNTCQGGGREPKIMAMRGRKENGKYKQRLEINENEMSNTITSVQKDNLVVEQQKYRTRKLTCRECFRLMGVDDADIDKIQASGISNSQQYKLAGNSIVVDVLYHIFRKAFVQKENESPQLTFDL